MTEEPLYLYGIVRAGSRLSADRPVVEPSSGGLRVVEHGDIAAVASPMAGLPVRPTSANLEAHQQVVGALFDAGVVLPVRFGVVAGGEAELCRDFLLARETTLRRMLDRFDGMVEMRVSLRYRGDGVLHQVLRTSAKARRLRHRIGGRPAAATYYDRIALGQEVAAGIERIRERDAASISSRLEELAAAARLLSGDSDSEVFRAAYLIGQKRLGRFEERAVSIAEEQADRFELELVGPLAPWDFVELGEDETRRERSRAGAAWAS